jgi:hypothetical protein
MVALVGLNNDIRTQPLGHIEWVCHRDDAARICLREMIDKINDSGELFDEFGMLVGL